MKGIYLFDEGIGKGREILGGKGGSLVEMKRLGLPIPNGFIISTKKCVEFLKEKKFVLDNLFEYVDRLENITGKNFGGKNPLLVSVRSGAPISMPGMMDTILNLGINDEVAEYMIEITKNEEFVKEIYKRFIEMFSEIVIGINRDEFKGKNSVEEYKEVYFKIKGEKFPQDVKKQLKMAIEAIFFSWENERAKLYRRLNNIDDNMGTAVVVQEMVFGNYDEKSGTGVVFTRDPIDGSKNLFGEYLLKAQGEDVVAGIKTPKNIENLKEELPEIYNQIVQIGEKLEKNYKDMQDIEFTIEKGKLYILQSRNGKRSGKAGIKIAIDMVKEGILTKKEAIQRVELKLLPQVLNGTFEEGEIKKRDIIGKGLPASPGIAVGKVVFNSEDVKNDDDYILIREETSPEDIRGMYLAKGLITIKGGMTSHGAVVARGMGRCCITACEDIKLSEGGCTLNGIEIKKGDFISIDGYTGNIYLGKIKSKKDGLNDELKELLEWCKVIKDKEVWMNADTLEDIEMGLKFGAEGVGLCRTEHMFFKEDKILAVREMIIARDEKEREIGLDKILKYQSKDFYEILKRLKGYPLTIRLLDPPLHEFLPKTEKDKQELCEALSIDRVQLEKRIEELKESNPMLGDRGSRLGITYPEIYKMQIRAIVIASEICKKEGIKVDIEIMLPLIMERKEFKVLKEMIKEIMNKNNIKCKIGTMIELPRACLLADELAKDAEFFSFGTNDLTQTTFGISRDDSEKFIGKYIENELLSGNPFETIDKDGVGKLIELAIKLGRSTNKELKIGICGEHGGDWKSVEFLSKLDLDYLSCSPYRVPISVVALAKEKIKREKLENV